MTTLLPERRKQLSSLNDPLLGPIFEARDEAERGRAIERIVMVEASPLIHRVLSRESGPALPAEDLDDIAATIHLRLVQRLQNVAVLEDAAITSFGDFVATLTYRAMYETLRRRFPLRARLKNRLRYVLTHDKRLALWNRHAGMVAGKREWLDRDPEPRAGLTKRDATTKMLDPRSPADAVLAIFDHFGNPLLLDDLVNVVTELWDVVDRKSGPPLREAVDRDAGPLLRMESREYLAILWEEIRALRTAQRVALLLNLRDGERVDALALLVLLGIAPVDEIAATLEIPVERLAGFWNALPLDDLSIAAMLGVTRQQVINLRKTARERLGRRMKARERNR